MGKLDRLIRAGGYTVTENDVMATVGKEAKLVYWALSKRARNETGAAWPSQATIANDTARPDGSGGLGVTSVKAGLAELLEAGFVRVQRTGRANLYVVGAGAIDAGRLSDGRDAAVRSTQGGHKLNQENDTKGTSVVRAFHYWWRQLVGKRYQLVGAEIGMAKNLGAQLEPKQVRATIEAFLRSNPKERTVRQYYLQLGELVNAGNAPVRKPREHVCPHCGVSDSNHMESCPTVGGSWCYKHGDDCPLLKVPA